MLPEISLVYLKEIALKACTLHIRLLSRCLEFALIEGETKLKV